MILHFKDSQGSRYNIELDGEWVDITDIDEGEQVCIPAVDLPQLIHELQIIANEVKA